MTAIAFEDSCFTAVHKAAYLAAGGAVSVLTGWLFYKNIWAALIFMAFPLLFYRRYKLLVIKSVKERVNIEFKDVLYSFSDAAASGRQADSAVANSYKNLKSIYGDENILTKEFEYMSAGIKETKASPERLLTEFGNKMGIEDIRNFIEIYCICIKTGGDKEKAINRAAEIIRERIALRKELSTALIQKKIEACILCSIPVAVLAFMQMFSKEYADILYTTLQGRVIMTVCLAAVLWAAALCLKIMDIRL